MQLLLSTNNRHKRSEFQTIFSDHDIVTPGELGIELEVEETGGTFLENALLKAHHMREALRAHPGGRQADDESGIVIADDSGLCVDALGGGPGIYSARFGSPDGGRTELAAEQRNKLLLQALENTRDRSAHFVCCMVALLPGDRLLVAQESWTGEIAQEPSHGTAGFGYDPVFLVPGLGITAADLAPEQKNELSHRGRASRVLAAALRASETLP